MTADELNLETRDPFIFCDWIIVSCSLIKSQTETVEMEVFIVPEKREIIDKNTPMLYLKKKPNLSLNKSRITFSLFCKKRYDSCWLFYRFFKVFCFTHLYWKFSQFYFLNVWLSFFFVSLTDSPGQATFDVKITSSSGRVRAWVQKLDRKDGSFIVRYRLFASYPDLTIEITHKGKNVANSPYKLEGKGM